MRISIVIYRLNICYFPTFWYCICLFNPGKSRCILHLLIVGLIDCLFSCSVAKSFRWKCFIKFSFELFSLFHRSVFLSWWCCYLLIDCLLFWLIWNSRKITVCSIQNLIRKYSIQYNHPRGTAALDEAYNVW